MLAKSCYVIADEGCGYVPNHLNVSFLKNKNFTITNARNFSFVGRAGY